MVFKHDGTNVVKDPVICIVEVTLGFFKKKNKNLVSWFLPFHMLLDILFEFKCL